jgi:hypothetical protein
MSHHSYGHKLRAIYFAPFHQKSTQNRPFFFIFLCFSYALVHIFSTKCESMDGKKVVKYSKNQKMGFFFTNIFFLKVKMDMVFMSIFKKKDRIFTTFFPAFFHLTGLNILASNTLLSQKKSEISICPNRGYVSDLCA